jgi:hypothetical protein
MGKKYRDIPALGALRRGLALFTLLIGINRALADGNAPAFFDRIHPTFGLPDEMAFPSTAYRASDNTVFCAFATKTTGNWEAIDVVSTHDGGRTWSAPVRVMACPGPGYIADPNLLVARDGISLFATFVPKDPLGRFAHSEFLSSKSVDGVHGWTTPAVVPVRHQYMSGKTHMPVWIGPQTAVMGYSYDLLADAGMPALQESEMSPRAGVLITKDAGITWRVGGSIFVDRSSMSTDEPALVLLSDGELFTVVRTTTGRPFEARSGDGGMTWDQPRPSSFLGNNSPTALLRLHGGAVLRVWDNSDAHRYPLVAAISRDDCRSWSVPRTIVDRVADGSGRMPFDTACYPSMAESADGTIVLFWWERDGTVSRLGLARFNESWTQSPKRH